jgi:hypothetical protein
MQTCSKQPCHEVQAHTHWSLFTGIVLLQLLTAIEAARVVYDVEEALETSGRLTQVIN